MEQRFKQYFLPPSSFSRPSSQSSSAFSSNSLLSEVDALTPYRSVIRDAAYLLTDNLDHRVVELLATGCDAIAKQPFDVYMLPSLMRDFMQDGTARSKRGTIEAMPDLNIIDGIVAADGFFPAQFYGTAVSSDWREHDVSEAIISGYAHMEVGCGHSRMFIYHHQPLVRSILRTASMIYEKHAGAVNSDNVLSETSIDCDVLSSETLRKIGDEFHALF